MSTMTALNGVLVDFHGHGLSHRRFIIHGCLPYIVKAYVIDDVPEYRFRLVYTAMIPFYGKFHVIYNCN